MVERINRTMSLGDIKPNPRNARTHSKKQVRSIARSMQELGFGSPLLVDEAGVLIAGHGRLEAARLNEMAEVPVVQLIGLSEAQKRALMLAENKIALTAGWDREQLAMELPELTELLAPLELDIAVTGFEPAEVDQILLDFEESSTDPADDLEAGWGEDVPASVQGDLWVLGGHRLLCGDARHGSDLAILMGENQAAMAFLDPPYNVRIAGLVGRGRTKHREFAMASGEMNRDEFTRFLVATLGAAANVSRPGALHYVCMDWRHLAELFEAGKVYSDMLNLVVWDKTNAGQGSFYRSQHEMLGVFRVGDEGHLNNVELGKHGRNRSNVWRYAGVNTFRAGRLQELRAHPTAKPVAMIADAMKDCTRRGDIVLDTFSGSGSTLMAAERVGRRARVLELDSLYVDVAIRRWQGFTGRDAVHAESGRNFDEIAAERAADAREVVHEGRPVRRRTGRAGS